MTGQRTQQVRSWPRLRVADSVETRDTLRMWTQVVGKIQLAHVPNGQPLVAGHLLRHPAGSRRHTPAAKRGGPGYPVRGRLPACLLRPARYAAVLGPTAIELPLDMVTEGSARALPEPMARPRHGSCSLESAQFVWMTRVKPPASTSAVTVEPFRTRLARRTAYRS
jgi:hypothetical protein